MKKMIAIYFFLSSILSISAFSFIFYAMRANNNQGEIYDTVTGAYDVLYIAGIFGCLLIESFVVVAVLYLLPALVMRRLADRKRRRPG